MTQDWQNALHRELDCWEDGAAHLWWRDDDAHAPSRELDHLLALAARFETPLGIAVIPHTMHRALAKHLRRDSLAVLQHGYAHINHARAFEKKIELGGARSDDEVCGELADGMRKLADAFGETFLPVLTPPWNRIAPHLLAPIAQLGYVGVSTFAARNTRHTATLRIVNTHVDIIDWRRNKQFIGASQTIAQLTAHLRARRCGQCDAHEPTGLLTHHLVHDAACLEFLPALLAALSRHPAVQWLSAPAAFGV